MRYSVMLVDGYQMAAVITNTLDSSAPYVSDAKIAILTNYHTGEVVSIFHTIDTKVFMDAFNDYNDCITGREFDDDTGILNCKLTNGDITVSIPFIHADQAHGEGIYVADIEDLVFTVDEKETEESFGSNRRHDIGFKHNNSMGYIISEVKALLKI